MLPELLIWSEHWRGWGGFPWHLSVQADVLLFLFLHDHGSVFFSSPKWSSELKFLNNPIQINLHLIRIHKIARSIFQNVSFLVSPSKIKTYQVSNEDSLFFYLTSKSLSLSLMKLLFHLRMTFVLSASEFLHTQRMEHSAFKCNASYLY